MNRWCVILSVAFPTLSDSTYCIEAEIGSGGGGVVYKAWHTRLQKYVVIKELKSSPEGDIHIQRNEIEALKNVKSAYLPQVYGCLKEGDRFFTVMEFIEGKSLDKLLESGYVFTQAQVVKWYGQLVSALETIHSKNICHRDIKPANIMLTPDDDVCLIDFSAALVNGNDIKLISRSLGYASPEQYEKYEHYKNAGYAPINPRISAQSNYGVPRYSHDDNKTEWTDTENRTEFVPAEENADQKPAPAKTPALGEIDWERSDIYSLGAAMYHLLTGKRPSAQAADVVPISRSGRFGEGIAYVVEQSMRRSPSERFASAAVLARAVSNMHKHDTRWKIARSKRIAAAVVLPTVFALFATTAVIGGNVMAQEKEERYYAEVYAIENGANPLDAYNSALSIYWDRIDPYRAMAKRLWIDDDIDACREFIERNIGNIAKFQSVPEMQRSFGDIYYILGNCYYYQPGGPDYFMARDNFAIAARFVTDNPVYYRDYAISLAKTGDVEGAIALLEQLSNGDAPQFNIIESLAILLQNAGKLDRAADVLERMAGLFPEDYRVPMRRAFLEAGRQSGIENESRDYALMKEYYDNAIKLYKENAGQDEYDPEMQQLESLINQLKTHSWLK